MMKPALYGLLAAALGMTAPFALAADAAHGHDGQPAQLHLNHGQKWATDEPLRSNMSALRAALGARIQAIHDETLTQADYQAMGATVAHPVGHIVAECKLEPEADAMLHLVIADLIAGADALQGKTPTAPPAGARQVVQALNAYGAHFEHPGWQPLDEHWREVISHR